MLTRCMPSSSGESIPRRGGSIKTYVFVVCSCAIPFAAAAQVSPLPTANFSVTVTEREDVVVQTGTHDQVDGPGIDRRNARTLNEALTFLPGIRVRSGGDGRWLVDFRGLRSRHVLLLLDGVPLNSTNDGQFDAGLIPTESIQDINASFGASSILYGDGAMGGVIEVVTNRPAQGFGGAADLEWRTGNQRNARARVTGARNRAAALLTASSFARDGFRLPDGTLRANSDESRQTALGKINVGLSNSTRVSALLTTSTGSFGIPPGTIDNPADPFAQRVRYERVDRYSTRTAQSSFSYASSRPFSARGWAFVNADDQSRARYDSATYDSLANDSVPGTFRSRERSSVSGGAFHGRFDSAHFGRAKVAFNARRERFHASGTIRDIDVAGTGSGQGGGRGGASGEGGGSRFGLRPFDDDHALRTFSTAVEWESHVTTDTGVVMGAARNWQTRPGAGRQSGVSGLVGVVHRVNPSATLRVAAFQKIRFPSIRHFYETGSGNAQLVPERSAGVEAGVERRVANSSTLGMRAFWMHTRDFIERDDEGRQYVNRDRYRLAGLETTMTGHPFRHAEVRASYGFLHAVDRSPLSERQELQYQPRHQMNLETSWLLPHDWAVRGAVAGLAQRVYYSRARPLLKRNAADYALVDASISKRLARRQLSMVTGVANIFNVRYEEPYAMPQEGRSVFVKIQTAF